MIESQFCAGLWAETLTKLYTFAVSDAAQVLFASIATARAIVYYCRRSPYAEARDLISVLTMAGAFAVLIAATESPFPVLVKQAVTCKSYGQQETATLRNVSHGGINP